VSCPLVAHFKLSKKQCPSTKKFDVRYFMHTVMHVKCIHDLRSVLDHILSYLIVL
jgi:hypothetical protein